MMSKLLTDYYRCIEDIGQFRMGGTLPQDAGYFNFGPDLICFGRSASGVQSTATESPLYDACREVGQNGPTVILPFDPTEIIDNLRYERYVNSCLNAQSPFQNLVRNVYYLLRPTLHVSLRKRLQKIYLNGWRELDFPRWPVDRSVDQLMRKLLMLGIQAKGLTKVPFVWFWPDGANGCVIMTHDVETKSGQSFCPQLMDINESYGIPASFQVVPEKRYPVSDAFLNGMRNRGFEINIQDLNHDGLLFKDRDEFGRRAKKINEYAQKYQARGFRSAILYRNQEWYDALDFDYDMTVPNVAHLDPQRGGCCTVMPYFVGKILELPVTTTQDYSLFHILNDYSLALWKRQIELILEEHGLISFIIHPDYIISKRAQTTYRQLLELLRVQRTERNLWVARPQEVNEWWRKRNQMQLRRHQGGWRIEGPGAERARLAFASLSEGRLVYSVS